MHSTLPDGPPAGNVVCHFLVEDDEVGALGQVLSDESVGVLADAALAGAVRVADADLRED